MLSSAFMYLDGLLYICTLAGLMSRADPANAISWKNTSPANPRASLAHVIRFLVAPVYRGHENTGKKECHFCTHCDTVCLKVIFAIKVERGFF